MLVVVVVVVVVVTRSVKYRQVSDQLWYHIFLSVHRPDDHNFSDAVSLVTAVELYVSATHACKRGQQGKLLPTISGKLLRTQNLYSEVPY